MKGYEWIAKVREELELPSDYKAAELIGLTRSTVSQHKSGRAKTLLDSQCIRIAELLHIDPAVVILDQHKEAAKSESEKLLWERIAKTMGGMAATALLAANVGAFGVLHNGTELSNSIPPFIYYT